MDSDEALATEKWTILPIPALSQKSESWLTFATEQCRLTLGYECVPDNGKHVSAHTSDANFPQPLLYPIGYTITDYTCADAATHNHSPDDVEVRHAKGPAEDYDRHTGPTKGPG